VWDFFNKLDKGIFNNIIPINWIERLNEFLVRDRLIKNYRLLDFISFDGQELFEGTFDCNFNKNNLRLLYASLGFNIDQLDGRLKVHMTNFF
jgi:hypothetical protein